MVRGNDSGTTCVIYLLGDVLEVLFIVLVVGCGSGTKVLLMLFIQRCWRMWTSSPSWRLCWSTSAVVPLLSPELFLVVLCPCELQLNLRFGLPSSDVWCCRSCLVLRNVYLVTCALFGRCFAIVCLGGYFAAKVAPVSWILCRVASSECFAAVLLVDLARADTSPS